MNQTCSRRRALQFGGALATLGLGGCLGSSDSPTTTSGEPGVTTTADRIGLNLGESASVPERTVTVESLQGHQMLLVQFAGGVHRVVHSRPETQFLVAEVALTGAAQAIETTRDEMAVDLGSERYDVTEERLVWNEEHSGRVRVAFPLPSDLAETDGTVLWRGDDGEAAASWTVPTDIQGRLAAPPAFEVRSFGIGSTTQDADEVMARFEVANTGGSDGVFRAELGSKQISDQPEVAVRVRAGESVTARYTRSLYGPDDEPETIVLDWGRDSDAVTIRR